MLEVPFINPFPVLSTQKHCYVIVNPGL